MPIRCQVKMSSRRQVYVSELEVKFLAKEFSTKKTVKEVVSFQLLYDV